MVFYDDSVEGLLFTRDGKRFVLYKTEEEVIDFFKKFLRKYVREVIEDMFGEEDDDEPIGL